MFNRLIEVAMQKTYTIENLDCANCAAELENAVRNIKGINTATVSFMAQKLYIDFAADEETVMEEVRRIAAKIEPDCEITND